jgi:hypothetical protein
MQFEIGDKNKFPKQFLRYGNDAAIFVVCRRFDAWGNALFLRRGRPHLGKSRPRAGQEQAKSSRERLARATNLPSSDKRSVLQVPKLEPKDSRRTKRGWITRGTRDQADGFRQF